MKKQILKLVLSLLLLNSCSTIYKPISLFSVVDTRLVGSWSGTEKDNENIGLEKYWVQNRTSDGRFILLLIMDRDGIVNQYATSGKWWVKNGLFYEKFDADNKTDIFRYEFLNDDIVKFSAESLSLEMENEKYQFIENKINK